jgi:FG-GAP-like repeat
MRRFRFRLGTLLILIIVLGVGFAALRESNDTWDSSIVSLTLGVFLISTLLAIHRTGKRRAFWLGFALFGAAYLAMSLVPSIESRLITTKLLGYIDSRVSRSIPAGLAYFDYDSDGSMDLYVVNNSQPNVLYLNKGNGMFQDVTTGVGLNPAGKRVTGNGRLFLNNSPGLWLRGSGGTTASFMRIGHSLFALIISLLGGRLSGYLYAKNRQPVQGSANPVGPISNGSGG